ncbi:MAG: gamma-glutamyl-gamma-aminobutyrate hydrolase family protein [Hyphomicrobium sp.]
MSRPIVIIPACTKDIGGLDFDAVGRKYTAAVAEVAECQPLLVPVGPGLSDIGALLDIAGGIMLNVALGGSLHQAVHDQDELMDHREREGVGMDEKFGPVHPITLKGQLRDWIGHDEIMVNSLHGQGIKRLSDKLTAEAFAKDGLVEAVRCSADHPFCLGVQWHPEWQAKSNPVSVSLFRRFGAAAGVK